MSPKHNAIRPDDFRPSGVHTFQYTFQCIHESGFSLSKLIGNTKKNTHKKKKEKKTGFGIAEYMERKYRILFVVVYAVI